MHEKNVINQNGVIKNVIFPNDVILRNGVIKTSFFINNSTFVHEIAIWSFTLAWNEICSKIYDM